MAATSSNASKMGAGCLMLFALPFAAVGVGMGIWLACEMSDYWRIRAWQETPAKIVQAKLEADSSGDGGTSYRASAKYTYQFRGQQYIGDRVGLYSGSDNIGSFQQDAHRRLDEHRKSGRPFPCYVNPGKPSEAILFRNIRWEMVMFRAVFVIAFGSIGFGLIAFNLLALRRAKTDHKLVSLHPDQPWLCKKAWAEGKIKSSNRTAAFFLIGFAFLWNVISIPMAIGFFNDRNKLGDWTYLVMAFPAVGIVLILSAIASLMRWRKFGRSMFEMASVPGVIGGQLAGVIRLPSRIEPDDGFHLTLACVQKIGCGEDSKENVLWQDEQHIVRGLSENDPEKSAIPVLFQIPYDCKPTDETLAHTQTIWRLSASAKSPGANLAISFDVPVFQTPESDPNFVVDKKLIEEYAAPEDPESDLREAGIIKSESPTGEGFRLLFPMARTPGMGIGMLLAGCIFGGAPIGLYVTDAPWFVKLLFGCVFGAVGLLLLLGAFDVWFFHSVVDVSPSGLTVFGGWLGIGRTRQIDVAHIVKIVPYSRMSSSSGGDNKVYYDIDVFCKVGKKITIGKRILGKRLADSVIQQIEEALLK